MTKRARSPVVKRGKREPGGMCYRCKGKGQITEKVPVMNLSGFGFTLAWQTRTCERCQGRGRV